jgi:hypothetical protein
MKRTDRRRFIKTTAAGLVTAGLPALATAETLALPYPIVHHVFFWLKDPGSTKDRDQLVAGIKTLAKIETVKELRVGLVADTDKRDVVDNSWAVSELIFFKDLKGQATYQDHPIHLAFVKNCGHLWEKVIVYDAKDV